MLLHIASLILLQVPIRSLPAPITEPPNGYTIDGKLTFESNVRPVSMEVMLEVDDGQLVARTMSGPNGEFRFDRLRYGRYYVVVQGEKFWSIREVVNIEQGAFDHVRVSFPLKTRPGVAREGLDDVVSVNALRLPPPPKDAQKEYDKALEEQRKGNSKKAVEHLQKALKIAPDYYEANLQLGIERHRAHQPDEAIPLLERAVSLNSGSVVARTALGKIYFEKQDYQRAADALSELTKFGVSDPEAYTLLGAALYKLNAFGQAEQHLRHAIQIAPAKSGAAHLQLFNVYMRSNRLPMALEQLEIYLREFPNAADRVVIEQQAEKLRQILKK